MKIYVSFLPLFLVFIISAFLITSCKPKDSNIQANVESALKDNGLSGISTSVKDGIVVLTGECADQNSKALAGATAEKTKGVKQVVNNCTVTAPPVISAPVAISQDDQLTRSVIDATKDYPKVKATVLDGVITLNGDIKRSDLPKLMMTLNELHPRKIENKLTIK